MHYDFNVLGGIFMFCFGPPRSIYLPERKAPAIKFDLWEDQRDFSFLPEPEALKEEERREVYDHKLN